MKAVTSAASWLYLAKKAHRALAWLAEVGGGANEHQPSTGPLPPHLPEVAQTPISFHVRTLSWR